MVRQHDTQRVPARVEAEEMAVGLAYACVEDGEVQAACEASDHRAHLRQHAVDLAHVPPDQHMRHPRGGRQLLDVLLRRLRDPIDGIEWQRRRQEQLRGLRGHRDELARRNGGQFRARLVLSKQVAPDQPRVGLTDLDKRLPRAVMDDGGHIDAAIGHAVTKNRKMHHVFT